MLTTSKPSENEEWIYESTAAQQDGTASARLTTLKPTVLQAYNAYAEAADRCWSLTPYPWGQPSDNSYLENNYDRLRYAALGGVRQRLLARSEKCMRCDTATPSELDHHLPKRKFSEFAVLTLNLIPCCHLCNQKKGSKHLDTEGCPLFLHPFFDVLPMDEGYLCVEISFAALTGFLISFHVQQTESMSAEVFARLEKQFRELDLRTLYMRSALEDLRERRDAFYVIFETEGVSGMIQELSRSASSVENAHHKNFWKARVLRTLAADAAFCNGGFKALGPQELLT